MPLSLEIVTPERRVLSVAVDEVRAPGVLGGFGMRFDHEPFMTALEPGRLTYVEGGREHHYAVGGGFLQVADNRVMVLADTAEAAADIDVERARARPGRGAGPGLPHDRAGRGVSPGVGPGPPRGGQAGRGGQAVARGPGSTGYVSPPMGGTKLPGARGRRTRKVAPPSWGEMTEMSPPRPWAMP